MLVCLEPGDAPAQHGTCTEVGYAYGLGKPMIAVCPDDTAKFRFKFPLQLVLSTVSTLDEALNIISFAAGNYSGEYWERETQGGT
jgi:nucleoside 2-deoxyribosyltransferase